MVIYMSIIVSFHRWDGVAAYRGTFVHTCTLGWVTLTMTVGLTIEAMMKAIRDDQA